MNWLLVAVLAIPALGAVVATVARSEHTDVELRRDRFRSPVTVTVDGVLPLA